YSKPSWEDKDVVGSVNKGIGFPTVVEKVKVGSAYQYKVKNSKGATYYITASDKYVDVTGSVKSSSPATKTTSTTSSSSSSIKSVGKIKIVGVSSAAIVMDKPDRNSSKNIGTVKLGSTISISGSVKGKNNSKGYWEVIYNGKRGYISGQFGSKI
ncbi:N-acetylmuramoyl-L-alanine amidase family protein, partial [Bacillus spizizenii]|nr:N-acetylmuramoyl-L-alanine amidase family protein [Bacillus spizizenii]